MKTRISGLQTRPIGATGNGIAPSTLLLHGFTGSATDWADLGIQSPALAIDLPGHGCSPAPTHVGEDCFDAEIGRLLGQLPASIDRLVGYSLGGRIALGLLRLAPERFQAAVIIAADPGLTDPAERSARRDADRRWLALLREQGIAEFVSAWEAQPLFASQAGVPRQRLEAQRRQRLAQSAEGLARSLECFGLGQMPPTWNTIRSWRGRLHWISGDADPKFAHIAARVAVLRPPTALTLLPGIGHNPLIESPAQLGALIDAALSCASGV
jgi:2-succinyl-6-hydroxy-2,4-cyclohexadiene-1-carboxylate synthase